MKRIKMALLLLGLISTGVFFLSQMDQSVIAYTNAIATIFPGDVRVDDLKLNGNDILDSGGTTRITVGATTTVTGGLTATGALSSGSLTVTGNLVVPTVDVTATTPTVVGALVKNASGVLYISTATVAVGDWIKVGGQ